MIGNSKTGLYEKTRELVLEIGIPYSTQGPSCRPPMKMSYQTYDNLLFDLRHISLT